MYVCSLPLVEAGTAEKGELNVEGTKASPSASVPAGGAVGPVPKLALLLAWRAWFAKASAWVAVVVAAAAAAAAAASAAAPYAEGSGETRLCLVRASSGVSPSL